MIDGVIKYNINHTVVDTVKFKKYHQLENLRKRLFSLGFIGELEDIGYGNISLREKNRDSFFITATQTGKLSSLKKKHYVYIQDYDFSSFSLNSFGRYKPSSEALSHAMIYKINPDINAVIHIHSKILWNFMKNNNALCTNAEYGTVEMANEIFSLYDDKNPFDDSIFAMRGHEDGIIAFGRDIQEAETTLYGMINILIF